MTQTVDREITDSSNTSDIFHQGQISSTEGVWVGPDLSTAEINIQVKDDMKIWGVWINGKYCCESNRSKKESEGKDEVWR